MLNKFIVPYGLRPDGNFARKMLAKNKYLCTVFIYVNE